MAKNSGPAPAALPSTQRLIVQIDAVNAGVWVARALVAVVAGVAALVGTNPGFGTWLDFVKCFFWGLGAQIVGDRLQDAKPSQVAASLGVTLPMS